MREDAGDRVRRQRLQLCRGGNGKLFFPELFFFSLVGARRRRREGGLSLRPVFPRPGQVLRVRLRDQLGGVRPFEVEGRCW